MKMTLDELFIKLLYKNIYVTAFDVYPSAKRNGYTGSFPTFDRAFREWRSFNPDRHEEKFFKAESGAQYKKFRLKELELC